MPARVVVIGAGFAGITVARQLHGHGPHVTLIDRHNFHTFQPLLYQVATAGLGADDIAHSVRGIFPSADDIEFRMATVTGIDTDARAVQLAGGDAVAYDIVVVAAGASTATFGTPGVERYAFSLKDLSEALALRNHVLSRFEAADADPRAIERGALTFVVVGGGPTGVELSGALAELFGRVLRNDFPRVEAGAPRVVLIEATDHLLGAFSPSSQAYAVHRLRQMGVELMLDTAVREVTSDGVELVSGERLVSETVVWVAGVRANPLADVLGFEQTRGGRVVVDDHLRVRGHDDVFAIGDIAAAPAPDGSVYPQLAPVAMQQARFVARSILGGPDRPFHYRDRGTMATIGRNAAVAELPGHIRIRGFLAWLSWLFLHLVYLIGFRNRLNVLVNWAWNYLTFDRGARLIVSADRRGEPD